MTIEHAPGTNGHLKHDDARREEPATPARRRAVGERGKRRRSPPLDVRGILVSALIAAAVALFLRRVDRTAQ